jgi:hypothetical protein
MYTKSSYLGQAGLGVFGFQWKSDIQDDALACRFNLNAGATDLLSSSMNAYPHDKTEVTIEDKESYS